MNSNMKKDLRRDPQKVLILGAGYVTPPVVDYLSSKGKNMLLKQKLKMNFRPQGVASVSDRGGSR